MITERKSGSREPPGTIHLYCEGYSTEYNYFDKMESYRLRVYRNAKYFLRPEKRDLSQIGESSPKKVLERLEKEKRWRELIYRCDVDTFLTKYLNAVATTNDKLYRELYPKRKNNEDRLNPQFNRFEELKKELTDLFTQFGVIDNGLVDIKKTKKIADWFMENEYPGYDVIFDEEKLYPKEIEGREYYGIVIDRDQFSKERNSSAMKEVRDECEKNNYFLVVTNPYFELWLAMHTDEFNKNEMDQFMRLYYELYISKIWTSRDKRESVGPTGFLKKYYPEYDKGKMNYPFISEDGLRRAIEVLKKNYKTNLTDVLGDISANDFTPMGSNILDIMGA